MILVQAQVIEDTVKLSFLSKKLILKHACWWSQTKLCGQTSSWSPAHAHVEANMHHVKSLRELLVYSI